jgi:hypothetical protein
MNIFPGNYERFVHQINANEQAQAIGMCSLQNPIQLMEDLQGDLTSRREKMVCIFDVENAFLHNAPLDGAYPVMVEITYLDRGNGKFHYFTTERKQQ